MEAAQVKEAEQYEAMKYRIRYMYEDGGVAAIEKIFTSGSISEMLNQAEYIQEIDSYDRKMLDEYVQTKNNIADLKAQLEQEQKNMQNSWMNSQNWKEKRSVMRRSPVSR